MEWNFMHIYLDLKAVVKIRLYPRGNLGVKVKKEELQALGSPPSDSCPFFPFYLHVACARSSAGRLANR